MEESSAERVILVIEDNPAHARRIKEAFNESTVQHRIEAIANGSEAMDFLHRRGEFANASRPDLILLDWAISGANGREILAEIKANPQLRRIPIVVLTLSTREEDILSSYSLQGNCYVIKSSDLDQLFQIVKRIEEFWLGIVTLPLQ